MIYDEFDELAEKIASLKSPAPAWMTSIQTYDEIRYLQHLSKRPLPRRKLRKCHMRRIYKARRRAKKRYRYRPIPLKWQIMPSIASLDATAIQKAYDFQEAMKHIREGVCAVFQLSPEDLGEGWEPVAFW